VVVVDTSVLVEVEAGNRRAAERVSALLGVDAVSVSVVTVYEMLAGPSTPVGVLDFWRRFFEHVEVLPVLSMFGDLGAAGARAANGTAAADGLIAATAAAYARRLLTADRALARFPGLEVEWIEPQAAGRH
jgi:predicted nucleic acid-binding protein